MKAPKTTILAVAGLVFGTAAFITAADDHAGHDHDGHAHAEEKAAPATATSTTFAIPDSVRKDVDLQTQVIESREIGGKGEAVTAIPISSVFELEGKTYVFVQSEDNAESFERWEVTTGAFDDQFVEAVTGVFPGDKLVSNGTTEIAQMQNRAPSDDEVETNVPLGDKVASTTTEPSAPAPATTETRRERNFEVIETNAQESGCRFTRERNSRPLCNRDRNVQRDCRREVPVRVIEDFHSHEYRERYHSHRSHDVHYHGHSHHHNW